MMRTVLIGYSLEDVAMSHGPEHHIEHAEHAVHAALSDYDKQVTISIAIIAAVLACVTMLGHRAHNETLQLKTLSARQSTEASNKWKPRTCSTFRRR
jgi:hypothetical protein